jgi:putative membrane protein
MMLDLSLAIGHHLLVFSLAAVLFGERLLLRAAQPDIRRLAGLDAMYGAVSVLILGVGIARVVWGGKGWAFYETNPFFWAKVGTFLLIGLASIGPTLAFLRWRRAVRLDPGFAPPAGELAAARRWTLVELALLGPLIGFAAAMARWPF